MKKLYLLLGTAFLITSSVSGQALSTVSGLRMYEHHSPAIAGSSGADGSQSGYDFVKRAYFHSFNKVNFGAYTGNQPDSIDMVEHNGPYTNGQGRRPFGFTSGMSSIWINEIKGNSRTKWMKAPASFNYATANDVQLIKAAWDSTKAKVNVDTAAANTTYIARIRSSNLYVAMRVTAVKNWVSSSDANAYFDFEYKYGTASTTGVDRMEAARALNIFPNPAQQKVAIENLTARDMQVRIISPYGQTVQSISLVAGRQTTVDIGSLAQGLYFVRCTAADGQEYAQHLIKN